MSSLSRPSHRGAGARQRGLSLITTLLFMVAALMLGVSALSINVMQERTIGNTKDRDLAFQAAEAALRDAEQDVARATFSTADADFTAACTNGLCTPPSKRSPASSLAVHDVAGFWGDSATPCKQRRYGQFTGGGTFPGVSTPPCYVIEKLGQVRAPYGETVGRIGLEPPNPAFGYRITARATGARDDTVVVLQSIYTRR